MSKIVHTFAEKRSLAEWLEANRKHLSNYTYEQAADAVIKATGIRRPKSPPYQWIKPMCDDLGIEPNFANAKGGGGRVRARQCEEAMRVFSRCLVSLVKSLDAVDVIGEEDLNLLYGFSVRGTSQGDDESDD